MILRYMYPKLPSDRPSQTRCRRARWPEQRWSKPRMPPRCDPASATIRPQTARQKQPQRIRARCPSHHIVHTQVCSLPPRGGRNWTRHPALKGAAEPELYPPRRSHHLPGRVCTCAIGRPPPALHTSMGYGGISGCICRLLRACRRAAEACGEPTPRTPPSRNATRRNRSLAGQPEIGSAAERSEPGFLEAAVLVFFLLGVLFQNGTGGGYFGPVVFRSCLQDRCARGGLRLGGTRWNEVGRG